MLSISNHYKFFSFLRPTLFVIPIATVALASSLASCSDNADAIGGSLVQDQAEVTIADHFTITGIPVASPSVQNRTVVQLIGDIDAAGYGKMSADFVTQFMPAMNIDTEGVSVNDIDSLRLSMAIPRGAIVGDSIVPMGLTVYKLTKQLTAPIYSDFNPEGYYDPSCPIGSAIYSCNTMMAKDSLQKLSYTEINVPLPVDMGRDLFRLYLEKPQVFAAPTEFAKYFPGLYVTNSYGSGRIARIGNTTLELSYRKHIRRDDGTDSIVRRTGTYFTVSPEVVTNNCISYAMASDLEEQLRQGDKLIVGPTGSDLEIRFPIEEVIAYYKAHSGDLTVLNTLTFKLPADAVDNDYNIGIPGSLLMVLSKDKEDFFRKNNLTNDRTSFYADYDATAGTYTFSGMRTYMQDMLKKDKITEEDCTFTLTPVNITSETVNNYYGSSTSYVSSITPYVSTPVMTRVRLDDATITVTFTKQSPN